MKTLSLDTSDSSNITAQLAIGDKIYEEKNAIKTTHPESILLLIESLFKKAGITQDEIDEIKVKRGPGSYTGLKVGTSIANALSFALQKPVNDKELGDFEDPQYT